ncbi:MAG: NADH-quinone oxidoreductase subunit J [Acidobacteriota bacterium]
MTVLFYTASGVAVLAALLAVTRANALHALLYLVLALFALSLTFYALGAPLIAAFEIIIYAGAIMVLILFAIMILNLGPESRQREHRWLAPRAWILPSLLGAALAAVALRVVLWAPATPAAGTVIGPREVGASLFGSYLIGVELASVLLLVGLLGAYYLGRNP